MKDIPQPAPTTQRPPPPHAQPPTPTNKVLFGDSNAVDHPSHYGGADNPYEVIKVIDAWGLDKNFRLGNVIKYVARAEHKGATIQDLRKAAWYLQSEIEKRFKTTLTERLQSEVEQRVKPSDFLEPNDFSFKNAFDNAGLHVDCVGD